MRAVVDRALAHERDGHRHVQATRECPQLRGGVAPQYAIPRQDQRPLRLPDETRRMRDRLVRRLGEIRVTRRQWYRRWATVRRGMSVAAMSSGISMCVRPGFSSVATRDALRTISGMAAIRSTRVFHFVTGSNIRTMSTT